MGFIKKLLEKKGEDFVYRSRKRKEIIFGKGFICFHRKHNDIKCSRIDVLSQTFNIGLIEFVVLIPKNFLRNNVEVW